MREQQGKYARHFLAYPFQGKERNRSTKHSKTETTTTYPKRTPLRQRQLPARPADQPAAEATDKGGQYQRLLLDTLILVVSSARRAILGSLAVGVIIARSSC